MKKVFLLCCSALLSQVAYANNNIQSVIDAFTNCDSSFFYQLKSNAESFEDITNLVIQDDIAYIPVDDITADDGNINYFLQPLPYRGLTIVGYQNIAIETLSLGQYYYWGFVIDGTVDSVKQSLDQLSWQKYNITSYVANPLTYDRKNKQQGWQNNPYVVDGIIPRIWTIEKSLYLEPINENQVHLVCSMQGDITKSLLDSIHPDIKYIRNQPNEKQSDTDVPQNTQTNTQTNTDQNLSTDNARIESGI
ncbi:hypothetical protein DES39_1013 [Orbus hercynius]|uniref:Uncharacterized protein n=1 Tax=Orbus hercynius TaxID=593135 RepID=A0A495RKE2_9GAMM|nr:hypothetical protein [Orbus hercynius]RKS87770.1 hypothetical protein DES39_1013 [Orbus hercynius]